MISSVQDYIEARIKTRAAVAKHILAEANSEAKLLASEHADVALQGFVRVGEEVLSVYSATILAQMGLDEAGMKKASEVAFMTPGVLPLDDAALAIWHWQQQLDDRASVEGVINHLKEEVDELTEAATAYNTDKSIKNRMHTSKELADVLILTLHLFALLDLDPAQCLAEKLKVLHERNYSGEPDAEGKVKHEEA